MLMWLMSSLMFSIFQDFMAMHTAQWFFFPLLPATQFKPLLELQACAGLWNWQAYENTLLERGEDESDLQSPGAGTLSKRWEN